MIKDKREFWNIYHEIHVMLSTPTALPNDMELLGTNIDKGGRGDQTILKYSLAVLKQRAGEENWDNLCEYYSPTKKHSDSWLAYMRGVASGAWRRIRPVRWELESVAVAFKRWKGDEITTSCG